MAKRFKVILKGNEDPIFLDFHEGLKLIEDMKAGRVTGMISLKGTLLSVSSIKMVVPEEDVSAAQLDAAERRATEEREWQDWKRSRRALSPKERAKDTSFFNFISQGLRGRPLSKEEIPLVREAQEKYFIDFPDAHNANPTCYFTHEDVSRASARLPISEMKTPSMKDRLSQYVLDLAERHLTA